MMECDCFLFLFFLSSLLFVSRLLSFVVVIVDLEFYLNTSYLNFCDLMLLVYFFFPFYFWFHLYFCFVLVHERTSERCIAQRDEAMETMKTNLSATVKRFVFLMLCISLCISCYQTWYYY